MELLLESIVIDKRLHSKWLNTLSMMENTGARKISASEHPVRVNETILKHAAEEARHAYYLKKQIRKIDPDGCPTYEFRYLLAPIQSYHYLQSLDVLSSRYLKENFQLENYALKYASYLFVTYAIEMRADSLYPAYQKILDKFEHPVNVKSIIAEEAGHLEEMNRMLESFSRNWKSHCEWICKKENVLFNEWMDAIKENVNSNVRIAKVKLS
ncbi:MAG: hypothetical protein DWQ44_07420 [Bacteroidetes bacterium]|nr:MAG: hypothetical protein DWQ33_12265 [Bacteroidota bacterium]REJ99843.1 MAG: hypothetical protein DWQ39_13040 [Bacteroidota bacterium]REK34216.1 MAG: hypothetical protein DWQ44_07420 [Bacteroidota bacterium]REK50546.1 MAG: hypothetical protein DWQ48_04330 [Bacteroidota bacterium]